VELSYNDAWHASHGELGGEFSRTPWDWPSLLAEAVKAKKPDFKHVPGARAAIRDGIEEIKNYRALVGVLTMSPENHSGLGTQAGALLQIESGRFLAAK